MCRFPGIRICMRRTLMLRGGNDIAGCSDAAAFSPWRDFVHNARDGASAASTYPKVYAGYETKEGKGHWWDIRFRPGEPASNPPPAPVERGDIQSKSAVAMTNSERPLSDAAL